jgi:hypothetical protein
MDKNLIEKSSDEIQEIIPVVGKNKIAFVMLFFAITTGWIVYRIDWNAAMLERVKSSLKDEAKTPLEKRVVEESADRLIRINAE